MQKVRLYLEFCKSTLVLNLSASVFLSYIIYEGMKMFTKTPSSFIEVYIHCCMFGGPTLCFFYKESSRKNEYYFYYNKGIGKIKLIIVTYAIYILLGIISLYILNYVRHM